MNIRRAILSDLPALMLLQERCHEPALRDSEADAAHDIATNEYLVACDGERVIGAAIGCCAASGEWFHVYSVETDPQHQRRGIGHRLMVALLARSGRDNAIGGRCHARRRCTSSKVSADRSQKRGA